MAFSTVWGCDGRGTILCWVLLIMGFLLTCFQQLPPRCTNAIYYIPLTQDKIRLKWIVIGQEGHLYLFIVQWLQRTVTAYHTWKVLSTLFCIHKLTDVHDWLSAIDMVNRCVLILSNLYVRILLISLCPRGFLWCPNVCMHRRRRNDSLWYDGLWIARILNARSEVRLP